MVWYLAKGIPSLEWCNDINERLVEKVAINACINPLTAIHGVKNGALLSEPYQARVDQIIAEVENILTELGYAQLASRIERTVRTVMADTADNTSSMLSDVMAGRRTEVDSIVGWLLDRSKGDHPNFKHCSVNCNRLSQRRNRCSPNARICSVEDNCMIERCRPAFCVLCQKLTDALRTIDTDDDLGQRVIRSLGLSIGTRFNCQ